LQAARDLAPLQDALLINLAQFEEGTGLFRFLTRRMLCKLSLEICIGLLTSASRRPCELMNRTAPLQSRRFESLFSLRMRTPIILQAGAKALQF